MLTWINLIQKIMTREQALEILHEYVESDSLRKHCYAVGAAMVYYAKKHGEDEDKWWITGVLHDFDWEKMPDTHPMGGEPILKGKGVPDDIRRAILSHAQYSGVSRDSMMEKTLFAVDELSGFVMAVAYVRPEKIMGMSPKSVKKKLKDKGFAAGVVRQDVYDGAEEMEIDFDEHIANVIKALEEKKVELGLV